MTGGSGSSFAMLCTIPFLARLGAVAVNTGLNYVLTGLVTKYIPELELDNIHETAAIVVGPPIMMKFAVAELLKMGMQEEQIWISQERKMCCGLGKCGHCRMNDTYICLDGPVFCYSEGKKLFD